MHFLDESYFEHLILHSIHLLSTNDIDKSKINVAKSYLIQFVQGYQRLYGQRCMSSNVHDFLHLSDFCVRFGPLYEFSCFGFESLNKNFVDLTRGTTKYEMA
jgi:hypothetical protein